MDEAVRRHPPARVASTSPHRSRISGVPTRRISWLRDLFVSVLIAIVVILFLYQPVKVEGTSMMPSLVDQERIFINKFVYRFGISDVGARRHGGVPVSGRPHQDPTSSA